MASRTSVSVSAIPVRNDGLRISQRQPPDQSHSSRRRIRRRKVVTFDLERTQLYGVPMVCDLPRQVVNASWYGKDEYTEMKAANDRTAKLYHSGHLDPEKFGFCYRGLEHKMSDYRQRQNDHMNKGFEAVLLTQDDLRIAGIQTKHSTLISHVYGMEAFPAQLEAHERGIADAKDVERTWIVASNSDRAPQIPRRTWARAC